MKKKIWIWLLVSLFTVFLCAGGYYLYSNFKSRKISLHKTDEKIQEVVKNTVSQPKKQLQRKDGKFEMTFTIPNDMMKKMTTLEKSEKENKDNDLNNSTNSKETDSSLIEQKPSSKNSESKSSPAKEENSKQTEIVVVVDDPKNEEEVKKALVEELKTQLTISAIMEVEFTPEEIHEYEEGN